MLFNWLSLLLRAGDRAHLPNHNNNNNDYDYHDDDHTTSAVGEQGYRTPFLGDQFDGSDTDGTLVHYLSGGFLRETRSPEPDFQGD